MISLCPLWLMSQATYCFRLGIKRSVSQLVLYSSLGSGLPAYEHRKTAHTQDSIYTSVYNPSREERFVCPVRSELSRFSERNSAKRFLNMSAALFSVRRYKDKNYLAKTFIMSCIFCKNTHFSPNGCHFDCIFNITPTCFYRNVWI